MLYNVLVKDVVVDKLEIPEGIGKKKFLKGVKNFYERKWGRIPGHLRLERQKNSNRYLILSNRGKLLMAIEEPTGRFSKFWAFINKDVREFL